MAGLKEFDLFADVSALCGSGRANNDQSSRRIKRGKSLVGQRVARREVVAITEDRAQARGDGPGRSLAPDQVLVDAEAFERAMQPFRPIEFGVAVGNECAIFERYGLGHGRSHRTDALDYGEVALPLQFKVPQC